MSRYGNLGLLLQICGLVMGNLALFDVLSDGFILFDFDMENNAILVPKTAKPKNKTQIEFLVWKKSFFKLHERVFSNRLMAESQKVHNKMKKCKTHEKIIYKFLWAKSSVCLAQREWELKLCAISGHNLSFILSLYVGFELSARPGLKGKQDRGSTLYNTGKWER